MAGPGIYLVALAVFLPLIEAHTCYVGQEAESEPGPGGYTRYRWVLQGEASLDPCGCTAFQLGGVNTVPSGGVVRSFNVSELSKTPEEILLTLGCQQGEAHRQMFVTVSADGIYFPFGQFVPPLRTTFELKVEDPSGEAKVFLAEVISVMPPNLPPYVIEFREDKIIVRKLDLSTLIQEEIKAEIIPLVSGMRQFTVIYEYTPGVNPGDAATVDIKVFLGMGGIPSVHVTDTDGKMVHHVGIFSTERAEWTFLNP